MLQSLLSFEPFGLTHAFILFCTLCCVIAVITLPTYISKYTIISLLLFQIVSFNVIHISQGTFEIHRFLPLHICTLTAYLIIIGFTFRIPFLHTIVMYWGLFPALLAIFFPDMRAGIASYHFWEFFVSHIAIVSASVLVMKTKEVQIFSKRTAYDIVLSYGLLAIITYGIVLPVNIAVGGNYMYLQYPATQGFDIVPRGVWYLPVLSLIPIPVLFVTALCAHMYTRMRAQVQRTSHLYKTVFSKYITSCFMR